VLLQLRSHSHSLSHWRERKLFSKRRRDTGELRAASFVSSRVYSSTSNGEFRELARLQQSALSLLTRGQRLQLFSQLFLQRRMRIPSDVAQVDVVTAWVTATWREGNDIEITCTASLTKYFCMVELHRHLYCDYIRLLRRGSRVTSTGGLDNLLTNVNKNKNWEQSSWETEIVPNIIKYINKSESEV
jgi:hypothetical protein